LIHTEGFRISAIFVGIFALTAAILAASLLFIVDKELQNQIVQFAAADIAAVHDGYQTEGLSEAREVIAQRMAAVGASDFFLLERNGRRLAGNLSAMPPQTGVLTLPAPGGDPRHAILGEGAMIAPGLYIFSGSDIYYIRLAHDRILRTLIWAFLAALLLAILASILVSRSFLSRTDAIVRTCRAIMDGNLKTRIPVRGTQDELDALSQTINDMLDRISGLMENLYQVTNDIAHDLRTPLTHLRHRLDRARLEAATQEDYKRALEAAITASDDILALFAALLRIAQIEGGTRRAGFAPVDLMTLLQQLRDMFMPVADDGGRQLEFSQGQSATISGDRELLVQLFSNLIENALVHTPQGTGIALTLTIEKGCATATVSDDGPGVPEVEYAKLFQRLYRREASRTKPGYGLGLAIVSVIAELHGARISTDSTNGFSVRVSFPLSA
jgi:signal transduction histidine kinase